MRRRHQAQMSKLDDRLMRRPREALMRERHPLWLRRIVRRWHPRYGTAQSRTPPFNPGRSMITITANSYFKDMEAVSTLVNVLKSVA